MAGERPAADRVSNETPDGDFDFKKKEMWAGQWAKKTKNGDYYLVGKCAKCGCSGMTYMNKREGWKIVKDNVEPEEEF